MNGRVGLRNLVVTHQKVRVRLIKDPGANCRGKAPMSHSKHGDPSQGRSAGVPILVCGMLQLQPAWPILNAPPTISGANQQDGMQLCGQMIQQSGHNQQRDPSPHILTHQITPALLEMHLKGQPPAHS